MSGRMVAPVPVFRSVYRPSFGWLPVVLDGWREAAAPDASETRAFANDRRAHLPPTPSAA